MREKMKYVHVNLRGQELETIKKYVKKGNFINIEDFTKYCLRWYMRREKEFDNAILLICRDGPGYSEIIPVGGKPEKIDHARIKELRKILDLS